MSGDLVYCKDEGSEKEMGTSVLECEVDDVNDTHIDCDLEDIPVTDLSEVKNASVKVLFWKSFASSLFMFQNYNNELPSLHFILCELISYWWYKLWKELPCLSSS